jgi:ribosome-associated heat shock protein Hsp15
LQIARVAKTRTLATKLCDLGRVRANGTVAKPHRTVTLGDRLEIESGDWTRILVVRELHEKPLAKAQAARLYEDLSPPRPALDPLARALRRPPVLRAAGSGRPTKRERRQLERALGDEF